MISWNPSLLTKLLLFFFVGYENDDGRRSNKIHKTLRWRNSLSLSGRNIERVLWTVWWHCGSGDHPRKKQSKIQRIRICKFYFFLHKICWMKLLSRCVIWSGNQFWRILSSPSLITSRRVKRITQIIGFHEISQRMQVQQRKKKHLVKSSQGVQLRPVHIQSA